jgi:hypothetical protein
MKKLLFACIAAVVISSSSCTKKQDCCVLAESPSIAAEINGEAWTGKPEIYKTNTDTIAITGRQTEQYLMMFIKFTGKGIYTLKPGQVRYTLTVGGDVSIAEYTPDETAINTLEVVEYDSTRGIIRGKFNLNLKLGRHYVGNGKANNIAVTQGTFTQYLPK